MNSKKLNTEDHKINVSEVITRLLEMKRDILPSEFDFTKSSNSTYCIEWGINKGYYLSDLVIDRYIEELKVLQNGKV